MFACSPSASRRLTKAAPSRSASRYANAPEYSVRIRSTPCARVSAFKKRISISPPGFTSTERKRMRSCRNICLISDAYASSRCDTAASRSTSIKKCTPPRRSRPSFIGFAPIDCSHSGVVGARFKATIKSEPSAAWITLFALIWVSTESKRISA